MDRLKDHQTRRPPEPRPDAAQPTSKVRKILNTTSSRVRPQRLPYIAMCVALTASLPAEARTSRAALVDSGWYGGRFFDHVPENTNYAVLSRDFSHPRRAFMVFRIPKASGRFTKARLRIFTYGVGSAEQIVGLYDVHTPIRHLRAGGHGMQAIYDDLGTGKHYGEAIVNDSDKCIEIPLSADAVADINARRGGYFAIGLANETIEFGMNWVFGASGLNKGNQLILDQPKRSK